MPESNVIPFPRRDRRPSVKKSRQKAYTRRASQDLANRVHSAWMGLSDLLDALKPVVEAVEALHTQLPAAPAVRADAPGSAICRRSESSTLV